MVKLGTILGKIFFIGWPSSVSHSINRVGMILLMSLVGVFGTSALAAFGVGLRLESLAIMPTLGVASALIPFVGQNLGAGKMDRVNRAVSLTSYVIFAFMVLLMALWYLVPHILFSPFTADPEVLSIGIGYFQIISLGYIFMGLRFIIGSAFQAAGRTTLQMMINLLTWAVTVGIAYMLVGGMGMAGIWWGFPIGNLVGFITFMIFLKSGFWLRKWKK